jgi:hypothetical protein
MRTLCVAGERNDMTAPRILLVDRFLRPLARAQSLAKSLPKRIDLKGLL